jgi:FMN phosphatase YigB (HAD superfamily)
MKLRLPAVIYDTDGTLVDVRPIRHLVTGRKKDFAAFHAASIDCAPNMHVLEAARLDHLLGKQNLVVTGRERKWGALTEEWLQKWDVPYAGLWMRPDGDNRKDFMVKDDILTELLETYSVHRAWDDNPQVIDLWKRRGIPVTSVPGWDEQ